MVFGSRVLSVLEFILAFFYYVLFMLEKKCYLIVFSTNWSYVCCLAGFSGDTDEKSTEENGLQSDIVNLDMAWGRQVPQ